MGRVGSLLVTYGSCRGSVHLDPRVFFRRPAGRTRGSCPRIRHFILAVCCSKASLAPMRLWYYTRTLTPPNVYIHVHMHPYPLQLGHDHCDKRKMIYFLKCDNVGRIRGSNSRVAIIFLAGHDNPTLDVTQISRANLAGRVESSRVGSGRVRRFSNLAGRVGLGQIKITENNREARPDP